MTFRLAFAVLVIGLVFSTSDVFGQVQWIKNKWAHETAEIVDPAQKTGGAQAPFDQPKFDNQTQPETNDFEPDRWGTYENPRRETKRSIIRVVSANGQKALQPVEPPLHSSEPPTPQFDTAVKPNGGAEPQADYDIYRDRNMYPIAPRKPCNLCVRPPEIRSILKYPVTGFRGRPHMDKELGGCKCGRRRCRGAPNCSIFWPRPFSAKLEEHHPRINNVATCAAGNFLDGFDRWENFRLINYTRTDNGYCGNCLGLSRDFYGCLGASKQLSRVYGVGFRFPGVAFTPGADRINPRNGKWIPRSRITRYAKPDARTPGSPYQFSKVTAQGDARDDVDRSARQKDYHSPGQLRR